MIWEDEDQIGYLVVEYCPDCGGEGKIDFYPESQECLTCWGVGYVEHGCAE